MTNRATERSLNAAVLAILVLGVVSLVLLFSATNAVKALRQSSARSECRTTITNDADDAHWKDVADLALAAQDRDAAQISKITTRMQTEPRTQDLINEKCPAPLAKGS